MSVCQVYYCPDNRREHISARNGYGFGCSLCWDEEVPTLMFLTIGGYRARLMLDVCKACAQRLSAVVDARLEDRRIRQNKPRRSVLA